MVAYFLPMAAGFTKGGDKGWGTPTMDFWCCHGSLVQAQVRYLEFIYFENADGIIVSQYIPSELKWIKDNVNINLTQDFVAHEYNRIPMGSRWKMKYNIKTDKPVKFALQLRTPWWSEQKAIIKVNGTPESARAINGIFSIDRVWNNDEVLVEFPAKVYCVPLPYSKNKYAFMEGPIVLAGITDNDQYLKGDVDNPQTILTREYEHEYKVFPWKQSHYRTVNQQVNFRFIPLYEISDERYTIYFPVQK